VRQARRDIDRVIEELRARADTLVNTGAAGAARAEARRALDRIIEELREPAASRETPATPAPGSEPPSIQIGAKVAIGALGMEGTVVGLKGQQAEVDVRGKRLRAAVRDLRIIGGGSAPSPRVRVNVDLKPREGLLSEINVIGLTSDEAIDRVAKFLDDTLVTDIHEVRIVHGHGTGQLRKSIAAYLKNHPMVAKFYSAPQEQGGGGATIVELKD
jgi:DNA mismatch repair protein MutS2